VGELAEIHGTQAEVWAVAIERLHRDTIKERTMDNPVYSPTYRQHSFTPAELFDMFAGGQVGPDEIAELGLADLTAQVAELRPAMTDTDFRMTDAEIAQAIQEYAREQVRASIDNEKLCEMA